MAKIKRDKELYRKMRASGIRKKVARELARLPTFGSNGGHVPKAMRDSLDRLDGVTSELRKLAVHDERSAAAPKAARAPRKSTKQGGGSARKPAAQQKPQA